jgi:hypothetical protein
MSLPSASPIRLYDPIATLLRSSLFPPPTPARPQLQAVETMLAGLARRPTDIGISAEEWRALVTVSANALIVGPEELQARLWAAVWPTLKKPVCWTDGKDFWLPSEPVPTLILQEVERLSRLQQAHLLDWLHVEKNDTRVLTTTALPFYPVVECGEFLASLYYVLNPLTLKLCGPGTPA